MLANLYVVLRRWGSEIIEANPSIPRHGWVVADSCERMDTALRTVAVLRKSPSWRGAVILSFSPLTGVALRDHGELYVSQLDRLPGLGDEDALEIAAQICCEYSDRITALEQHEMARAELARPVEDTGTGSAIIE